MNKESCSDQTVERPAQVPGRKIKHKATKKYPAELSNLRAEAVDALDLASSGQGGSRQHLETGAG